MTIKPLRLDFPGASGATLAARLDLPAQPPRAYALFAHCFTCSKDLTASRKISEALTRAGIAVLRFDFTGLGGSAGDFASTNFTSNLGDLHSAIQYLRDHYQAPSLLIGHSLGGAAVLAIAGDVPEVKAVATIGAPADTHHVTANFGERLKDINEKGEAEVLLGQRPFTIRKQFVDDLNAHNIEEHLGSMKKPLLVMHAPLDAQVGIENATRIFVAAKHPKSFCSLDQADHLLSDADDAAYAAGVIAAWASRYIGVPVDLPAEEHEAEILTVRETGGGKYQNMVLAGPHSMLADEPTNVGGAGTGPSPYEYLSAALGACTSMTLRMYADRKKIDLGRVSVAVSHYRAHGEDTDTTTDDGKGKPDLIDHFDRVITLEGDLSPEVRARMLEIADKCPVHRTLEKGAKVLTKEG